MQLFTEVAAHLWRFLEQSRLCGQVWCGGKAMAYPEVICCVIEEGVRCGVVAGCTTFDRRWLKNVSQRRQRYLADPEVGLVTMHSVCGGMCVLLAGQALLLAKVQDHFFEMGVAALVCFIWDYFVGWAQFGV